MLNASNTEPTPETLIADVARAESRVAELEAEVDIERAELAESKDSPLWPILSASFRRLWDEYDCAVNELRLARTRAEHGAGNGWLRTGGAFHDAEGTKSRKM